MKWLYLALLMAVFASSTQDPHNSFLRTHSSTEATLAESNAESGDTEETAATTETEGTVTGETLCTSETYGVCSSDLLENGKCDTECANNDCGFYDVVDCSAAYLLSQK